MHRLFKMATVILVSIAVTILLISSQVKNKGALFFSELENLRPAQAVMILGARVYGDGRVSLMLRDRLDMGSRVYSEAKAAKILLSGDHGQKDYNEVRAMKDYLLEKGVPEEDIFMDHAGFNTYDSMYRAKEVFEAKSLIVVTQEYHLYRALFIAEEMGIEVQGIAADIHYYPGVYLKNTVRELAARSKAFVMAKIIKPEPRFLGETIPITGDGRATDDLLGQD